MPHGAVTFRSSYEWGRLILANIAVVAIPTYVYYTLRLMGYDLLWLHLTIAAVYFITAVVIIWEALVTITRRRATGGPAESGLRSWLARTFGVAGGRLPAAELPPVPSATFIVAAFLPNDREIIVATVRHLHSNIDRPARRFQVILAYNTPVNLPVEKELVRLAHMDPALRLLGVEGSESKAENVNAAPEGRHRPSPSRAGLYAR